MKVLVVDDEEEIRRQLSFILEDEGYEVDSAGDGLDALARFENQSFDVVITDLVLPGLGGMEILSKIKENRPETIVMMITGHGSEEKAVEVMKAGADDYISKLTTEPEEILLKLAKAIEIKRLKDENQQLQKRMEIELDIASKIQQVLLPHQIPAVKGFDVETFHQPAKQVGGDYHDLIELPSGKIGIAIGDVSGKGMPASLLMANVQASLRRYSEGVYSPGEILYRINNSLCPICQFIEEHRFITLFYGVLDPKGRRITYSNAGHNYPIVFRNNGDICELASETGLPCGIMTDETYDENQIGLEPGDVVVFYTDGITEATNSDNAMFGNSGLLDIVSCNLGMGSSGLVTCIQEALGRFIGDAPQYDDMTLMIIKAR